MYKPWNDWNLTHWLHHFETRNTEEIQLGLTRISLVAQRLELLSPECKVITVTGTNGKGSTVSALESLYHCAGYQVGAYTSPHLIQFNERIRINKKPVSDEALCVAFRHIEQARADIVLTYFEMATLAALWLFNQHPLDLMILEVGIGGRLDATNIINADVSIITTVDFDHQDYLGTSLEAIGFEKAGILREGKPFIYADYNPPLSILDKAKRLDAKGYLFARDYQLNEALNSWQLSTPMGELQLPKPTIQLKSAAAALIATELLQRELPISKEQKQQAMQEIFIAGRLQFIEGPINVLYDVSHNPQSATLLANKLKSLNGNKKIHAVFSALKDKDLLGLITPLKDQVHHWYPAQLENKRAISSGELLEKFADADLFLDICYTSPLTAFAAALDNAESGDLIVVYGSFYTVGQVLAAQHKLFAEKETQ